jgi:hypothetical protein
MKRPTPIAATLVVVASILIAPSFFAEDVASLSPKWELAYHSVVPLGQDAILLEPGNHALFFLASAESIDFEGWRQIYNENRTSLLAADGHPVEHYPRFVDFRITASARRHVLPGLQPLLVDCESQCIQTVNDYLLHLQFRVKIFRALHFRELAPKIVEIIGMPPDVPCDERIFRVSFDLGEVPVADRIVLEVLSPAGDRLTRFHLDM